MKKYYSHHYMSWNQKVGILALFMEVLYATFFCPTFQLLQLKLFSSKLQTEQQTDPGDGNE